MVKREDPPPASGIFGQRLAANRRRRLEKLKMVGPLEQQLHVDS